MFAEKEGRPLCEVDGRVGDNSEAGSRHGPVAATAVAGQFPEGAGDGGVQRPRAVVGADHNFPVAYAPSVRKKTGNVGRE